MNRRGMTLVEVMIVLALMSIAAVTMMSVIHDQMKANNFLQFQLQRTQLSAAISSQVLGDPNNCLCLFTGLGGGVAPTFPATPPPGTNISPAVALTQIGAFTFGTPGNCATASMPNPLITTTSTGGIST